MNSLDKRLQMSGFITFFLSGICSISSGIVVSLLQERYGFDYNVTGTLLSIMSIGNLMAGFATGVAFRAKCKMFSRHLQKPILKTEKGRFKGL